MFRFLSLLMLSMFSLSTISAQERALAWMLVDVQPLGQVLGEDYEPTAFAFLSPDGSALAWQGANEGLSVYSLADQETTFYPWPENFNGLGRFSAPSWSLDSQYLAFNESLFDQAVESDLWLLDRGTGAITDRTNDGLSGSWFNINNADKPFALDYLPTWNPVTNDLYFFRSTRLEESDTAELYLMPVERDEPKLAADLTNDVPVFSIYRPAAISPDGERLAFIAIGSDLDDPLNGVWLLDLKTGAAEQITSVEDLRSGLPTWQEESALYPDELMWAGNDALVVLSRDGAYIRSISQMANYVDLATQTVTPLTPFDDVPDEQALFEATDDPSAPVYRLPRSGVVSPDGSAFFFLRHGFQQEHAGISMVTLPPDGSFPVELGDIEDFEVTQAASAPATISADGKALMYGYLFQFEPES